MESRIVKCVQFDFFDGQVWHEKMTILDGEKCHYYDVDALDGPWGSKNIGDKMYDFQVYNEHAIEPNFEMQAMLLENRIRYNDETKQFEVYWSQDHVLKEFGSECFRNVKIIFDEEIERRNLCEVTAHLTISIFDKLLNDVGLPMFCSGDDAIEFITKKAMAYEDYIYNNLDYEDLSELECLDLYAEMSLECAIERNRLEREKTREK